MNFRKTFIITTVAVLTSTSLYAQSPKPVQHINLDEKGWEQMADKIERKYVYGQESMLAIFKMQKGAKVPLHQHPNEQTTYITKGSVKVDIQGKSYLVKAGETLIIPANIPHEFVCLEDNTIDIDFFAPPRKDWIDGTASYFTAKQPNLEVVAALDVRPGNIVAASNGRIFSTIHPLGSNNNQLVEIVNGKAVPYPSAKLQKQNKNASNDTFDTMLGITIDKNDRLWVTDMGLNLGKTRIWAIDIATNKVVEKITLPASVAPKGTFAQEIAIDEVNGWAYLADITNPGIIAVNTKTKKATRFSGHPSLQSEDKDMIIDGKVVHFGGKPARVAIDPLTLSADKETIYFGAMNGNTWYAVPARLFREAKSNDAIGAAITTVGQKPITDGAFTDAAGNHYFTDLQQHAITKLDAKGTASTLIKDAKLIWPDNVFVATNGWIYVSANQLNSTPPFTGGKDEGTAPFYLYKFKVN